MDQIKTGERVLLMPGADGVAITDDNVQTMRQSLAQGVELVTSPGEGSDNFDAVLWNVHTGPSGTQKVPEATQALILKSLKSDGKLVIRKSGSEDCSTADLISQLKLNGFVSISEDKDYVIAKKPNYAIGSSVKLNLPAKSADAKKVWSLADAVEDDNADMINTDDLLEEEDKQRPDPESLKVCGTTKKRKACANCTCGLAQELEDEAKANVAANQTKSSCGSCYLGDAFRCASCPYLGMPAFKPGEKILLDNTSDI